MRLHSRRLEQTYMIKEIKGNLLESNVDVMCHQVNCQGVMRSGIAKSIREKYLVVYEQYHLLCNTVAKDKLLGKIQPVLIDDSTPKGKWVINMFSQENYGYDKKRYTSYDAFWNCLNLIVVNVSPDKTIGFPKYIGCCRGGANWNIIEKMIEEVLGEREVYIYDLGI